MFEKVLKRLCPCYFKSDENELSVGPEGGNKTSNAKQTSGSSERGYSHLTNENSGSVSNSGSNAHNSWKGTLNLIQPQPIYAFPIDLKKPLKRNQKNLLKPPLYWKKTMKNLYSEGPPVFEDSKYKSSSKRKKKKDYSAPLKHSETVADITSVTSHNTVEVRWLKSQSLDNVSFEAFSKNKKDKKLNLRRLEDGGGDETQKDWNCMKCHVVSDFSHGVIIFTAVYFNKRKICVVNIDRLDNLSKKGKDGNTYHSIVKLGILPSEKYIKTSKILSNSSHPDIKQDFSFSLKDLSGKVLRLSVFDASLQKRHEAVGHALLNLDDLGSDQLKKYRIKLYRRSQPHVCPGNLAMSLTYYAQEDRLTIVVDKGRNISLQKDRSVKLNTYIKMSLYAYGEKIKTKKSIVVPDTKDPKYNSTFTFQVRKDQIEHLSVAVSVKLKNFVNDDTIGRIYFGPFFFLEDNKLTPWGRVFLKKEFVSHWFRLYL